MPVCCRVGSWLCAHWLQKRLARVCGRLHADLGSLMTQTNAAGEQLISAQERRANGDATEDDASVVPLFVPSLATGRPVWPSPPLLTLPAVVPLVHCQSILQKQAAPLRVEGCRLSVRVQRVPLCRKIDRIFSWLTIAHSYCHPLQTHTCTYTLAIQASSGGRCSVLRSIFCCCAVNAPAALARGRGRRGGYIHSFWNQTAVRLLAGESTSEWRPDSSTASWLRACPVGRESVGRSQLRPPAH